MVAMRGRTKDALPMFDQCNRARGRALRHDRRRLGLGRLEIPRLQRTMASDRRPGSVRPRPEGSAHAGVSSHLRGRPSPKADRASTTRPICAGRRACRASPTAMARSNSSLRPRRSTFWSTTSTTTAESSRTVARGLSTLTPTLLGTSIGQWVDEDGDGKYDVLESRRAVSVVLVPLTPPACRCTGQPDHHQGTLLHR